MPLHLPGTAQLQEKGHLHDRLLLKPDETVITDGLGKVFPTVHLYMLCIKYFQIAELFQVEQYHDGHDFAVRHGESTLSIPFALIFRQEVSLRYFVEFPAEFVRLFPFLGFLSRHKLSIAMIFCRL
jgi:hypothetical protein